MAPSQHWVDGYLNCLKIEWEDTKHSPRQSTQGIDHKQETKFCCDKPLKILRFVCYPAEPNLYWLQEVLLQRWSAITTMIQRAATRIARELPSRSCFHGYHHSWSQITEEKNKEWTWSPAATNIHIYWQHKNLRANKKNSLCLPTTIKISRSSPGHTWNSIKNPNGQRDRRMWILAFSSIWGRSMGTEKVMDTSTKHEMVKACSRDTLAQSHWGCLPPDAEST